MAAPRPLDHGSQGGGKDAYAATIAQVVHRLPFGAAHRVKCGHRDLMQPLPARLSKVARGQDGLFTRRQALDAGLASSSLTDRLGVSLSRPLPTVYTTFTGELTNQQRLRAAALYGRLGGSDTIGVIGGLAACHLHKLRAASHFARVELLVPHSHRPRKVGFVDVRRTVTPFETWQLSGLPLCAPARAVVDAARRMEHIDAVRALAAEAVQRSMCTTAQLTEQLAQGGSAGSRLTRAVLAEVADGVRSVAEAWLRTLINTSTLPTPLWNADLFDESGRWLARPDAIWPEVALVAEVESKEWHLSPENWAATMERTNLLGRLGYDVQQFPPSRIKSDAAAVIAEIADAHAGGMRRSAGAGPSRITVRPAASGTEAPGAATSTTD